MGCAWGGKKWIHHVSRRNTQKVGEKPYTCINQLSKGGLKVVLTQATLIGGDDGVILKHDPSPRVPKYPSQPEYSPQKSLG